MRNKKIENIIKLDIEKEVPDVLDNVLKKCTTKEINMNNKRLVFPLRNVLAFSSFAIIALFIGIFAFNNNQIQKMDSTVIFDINPSIEIKVDKNNNITSSKALNSDGKKILADMDLKGSKLNIGVNAIIGSMYKNGYVNELKNSILVTVDGNSKERKNKLQKEIANEINETLNIYKIESAILTQEYNSSDLLEEKAKNYGISKGKAELLEKIIESNLKNKNNKEYTFEDLVDLTINELNVILNSKNQKINNVTSSGNASTKAYIGKDKAKQIAINSAKVNENNIYDLEIELDYEYRMMIYEVSFDTNGIEYEYEINAITGEIINGYVEQDNNYVNKNNQSTSSSNKNVNYISRDKAKQIAFSNAGVNISNIRDLSIELDRENGKIIYEVEFEHENKDYEYDIDAITGKILYKNIEIDD